MNFGAKTGVYLNYFGHLARVSAKRATNLPAVLVSRQLEVELNSPKIGLFAQLNWCIKLAAAAEAYQRRIHFACTSGNYSPDGKDWLGAVLRQQVGPRERLPWFKVRLTDLEEFPFPHAAALDLTIAKARAVFHRHFLFSPEVMAGVSEAQSAWPQGRTIIGIHYRGTDKSSEARRVSHEAVMQPLAELTLRLADAGERGEPCYYVATDEADFIRAMREQFGASRVLANPRAERSASRQAVHLTQTSSLQRAQDAMIDAALLAACPILLRTSSFLSGWAAVLAQTQQVVTLNQPYAHSNWFPDSEIAKVAYQVDQLGTLVDCYRRGTQGPPTPPVDERSGASRKISG